MLGQRHIEEIDASAGTIRAIVDPFLAVADTAAKQGPYVAGSGRVNVMNGRDRFCGTRVDPAMTFGYAAGRLTSGVIDGEIVSELQNDGV